MHIILYMLSYLKRYDIVPNLDFSKHQTSNINIKQLPAFLLTCYFCYR